MTFEERLQRVRETMTREKIDVIIAFSAAAHHIETADRVSLLSGFKPLASSAVIFGATGKDELVVTPSWDAARAQTQVSAMEITGSDDFVATMSMRFRELTKTSQRIAVVDLDLMPQAIAGPLKNEFGTALEDGLSLIREAASRKTLTEIENAKKATEIAEAGYAHMLEIAKIGMPECELAAAVKGHTQSLGGDDNFFMMHAENHPLAVQPSGERPLEEGDIIVAEVTPSYRGQYAQICRTAVMGEPSSLLREKYDLVVTAMHAGIKQAKPGNHMAEVCGAIDEVLTEAGYGEYCKPPYMNRRGHGLGISSVIPGNVSNNNGIVLQEDQFFVIHPNQYIPEVGYLLCGEPVALTPSGAEILTKRGASLDTIAL